MSSRSPIRYLALGDSYTIGTAVPFEQNYPNQLVQMLRSAGIDAGDAQIIATDGWTTDELIDGITSQKPGNNFDLVSLLIGVNNQYRGRTIENFDRELSQLIRIAVAAANGFSHRVFILSIPDWGVTPFAEGRNRQQIANEIDAFNYVIEEQATAFGCHFISITASARQSAKDPSLLATDGLHLSGLEYANWAKKILPLVINALEG